MPIPRPTRALVAAATAALLGACGDSPSQTQPAPQPGAPAGAMSPFTCTADRVRLTVECERAAPGGARGVLLGGQGVNVRLTSSNVAVTADTVAFDVTIKNLLQVPLGTTDGTTPHPDGVRAFFASLTTTGGTGQVYVANRDGLATFTAANQPYFAYDEILGPGATSQPRRWKLRMDPGVTTFQFTLYVSAPVPPTNGQVFLSISTPTHEQLATDTLRVTVFIDSAKAPITGMWATLAGRSVPFSGSGTGPGRPWYAKIPLAGLPRGPLELRVTASTGDGTFGSKSRTIIHDDPPVISAWTNPLAATVPRPEIRIDAECTDDDPAGCASIQVIAFNQPDDGSPQANRAVIASGTTSIHTTVSLAARDTSRVGLDLVVTDSRGQKRAARTRFVYVENSPLLTEIASGGVRAVDADATRLMFMDAAGALFVRSGGVDHQLWPAAPQSAQLHPYGALFVTTYTATPPQGYDWRPGSLTDLGRVNSQLKGRGQWAIRSNATSLYRVDLAAQTTQQIAPQALNHGNDVTETGVVAYAGGGGGSHDIYRYENGVTTRLTNDADNAHWNMQPVTDGTTTVYFKSNQGGRSDVFTGLGTIAMYRDGVETILTSQRPEAGPGQDYRVNSGWVAYVAEEAGGARRAYTRDPSGVVRPVATTIVLEALGPDGTVVYRSGNLLYSARPPYTGAHTRIARDWSRFSPGIAPRVFFRGTELWMMIGRSAFRASY